MSSATLIAMRGDAVDREFRMQQTVHKGKGMRSDECDDNDISQPLNMVSHVSDDMRLIQSVAEPQGYSPSVPLFSKIRADDDDDEVLVAMEENSQAPSNARQTRVSQQPSPEYLASLGIKVRDFAYESKLPPIIPVPRIPRQVQPEPLPKKQYLTQWDQGGSQDQGISSQFAKPHSQRLERKATEPLDKESLQYAQVFEQTSFRRTRSPTCPITQVYALPSLPVTPPGMSSPTSPLTPLSQEASQELKLVRTPTPMKFVTNDVEIVTASQAEDSQPDVAPCPQSISPSVSPVSLTRTHPVLPHPSLCIPEDLAVEGQPTTTPSRRRMRPVVITGSEAPSANRYQLRRRPSARSRRPQPYPVTSTATTKKNSMGGQHPRRTRHPGPVR